MNKKELGTAYFRQLKFDEVMRQLQAISQTLDDLGIKHEFKIDMKGMKTE